MCPYPRWNDYRVSSYKVAQGNTNQPHCIVLVNLTPVTTTGCLDVGTEEVVKELCNGTNLRSLCHKMLLWRVNLDAPVCGLAQKTVVEGV